MNQLTITFNGNDITVLPGVNLYNHDFNALPERIININKIARRDLSIITSSEYSSKEITVSLYIAGCPRSETETMMTFLKSLLQAQSAPLVVLQGGEETEYTATMNEFNYEWVGNTAYVEIMFLASDPIGRIQETKTLTTMTAITTVTDSSTFNVEGSAPALPFISVTVATVTGGTGKQISIVNGRNNQGITVTHDWVDGDILQIDSVALEARINGTIVDFTGLFPQFLPGSSQLNYVDTFTTRSVDITATYNPRLV